MLILQIMKFNEKNLPTTEFLVTLNIMLLSAVERYNFFIKKEAVVTDKEYKENSCFLEYRSVFFHIVFY